MNLPTTQVHLNRFPIRYLSQKEKTVNIYSYAFKKVPEAGKEYSAINRITWKIGAATGVRFGNSIVTKKLIQDKYLNSQDYILKHEGVRELDPSVEPERIVLERLERKHLIGRLRYDMKMNIDRAAEGGFIWWKGDRRILSESGWEVHNAMRVDLEIEASGEIFVEIDSHHRFYTQWNLAQWLEEFPQLPVSWVRNTYDERTWKYLHASDKNPESYIIERLGKSIADYHRQLEKSPATEAQIKAAQLVFVGDPRHGNRQSPHLSTRLKPSITMEILSYLAEKGQGEAQKVFKIIKEKVNQRLEKGTKVALWLAKNIYNQTSSTPQPQQRLGIILRTTQPVLLAKSGKIRKPVLSLDRGCLRVGEQKFGCLNLLDRVEWPDTIRQKLLKTAEASGVEIELAKPKTKRDLPETVLGRSRFWQDWADDEIKTVLVVSEWLKDSEKVRLRREALQANIALQFMLPMFKKDDYRGANVVLGLLVKAAWQTVGLAPLTSKYAADLVIGFDAGTNGLMHFGTSAFSICANGQSLGWEVPEAQPGEKLSSEQVQNTINSIINRFKQQEHRNPVRILILRDGLVQYDEFDNTVGDLNSENIAVDLLGVRKSGTGRMAVSDRNSNLLVDAKPGTIVVNKEENEFCLISSVAKAGGSSRPLKIVRERSDAPIEELALQIDRLCQLNPASAFFPSRLPYVLHFADKMAKEVQRLGSTGVLQGVDRYKLFFA